MAYPEHRKPYTGSVEVAKELGISLRQLYHWVDVIRVVTPEMSRSGKRNYRLFTDADVMKLKQMRDLVTWGYTVRAASDIVKGRREVA